MKPYLYLLVFFCGLPMLFGQSQNPWKGYFSFTAIKDISQGNQKFVAAAENALFSQQLNTNVSKTVTTVDGLAGQNISSVYYSQQFNKTLIGYENGLMTVINEADGTILKVVDIINKQLPPNIKKVNHFSEYDGMVYVSCDFGICQYNLATLQFGDTYFIGPSTPEIVVNQTTVFDGYIYAATANNGVRRALVTNPNLIDATQWTEFASGSWVGVANFGTQLVAAESSGTLYRSSGGPFQFFSQVNTPLDFRAVGDYVIVTSADKVSVFNTSLGIVSQVNATSIPDLTGTLSCATVAGSTLFIGTTANGVFETTISNPGQFTDITPAGPIRNYIFSLNTQSPDLWMTYGGYSYENFINPYPLDSFGISKFSSTDGWKHIPYEEMHEPGKNAHDLVRMTFNPANLNQFYVSSYFSGLLKFENETLVTQYDNTNSQDKLRTLNPSIIDVRVEQSVFDRNGTLWMSATFFSSGIKSLSTNGTWEAYDMTSVMDNPAADRYNRMVIDSNGVKWVATEANGVVGFYENGPTFQRITVGDEAGNLPVSNTRALAIDKRGALWIGTILGLRVVNNVGAFSGGEQIESQSIIILDDDGVAQELFYREPITDIAVDGANNKWVSTADAGVFLLSPNGQETIYHFTIDNSPLPSNEILDIEINGSTGEVFIATTKGLVSFGGISTDSSDNLDNVKVYPNPVRPEYTGTVKITNLIDNANVKIADIAGNLVFETIAEGGTIEWDTTAFGKYRVASGVYMIFISTDDGLKTRVKKVMIVR
ncbi:type IX secretion system anionic LPS delivery protein PorZ [Flavobacterium silvaticum]|uniref:T9SS type A sorting domain-containing protein n=1 Tax=Flavobacterium silvaticum TaxID=1852020 RepID=A0A972FNR3_9FLAO|nr:T9SS type A sorting domain-containing protein [Flavobacterium silvaticum]NMH26629.1 T9SS type A sorting domain-containing protein [Flavobacterium silvaticum]